MNSNYQETDILGLNDQRLSLITNRAALEFDSAARGEPIGFESSKRLFEFIISRIGASSSDSDDFNPTDMLTFGLIGESILTIPKNSQKTTIADIVSEIRRLAASLASLDKQNDKMAALEELRNFCVALNRRIIAERKAIVSRLPSNPYKRQICPVAS
jgi:hypothetical protein